MACREWRGARSWGSAALPETHGIWCAARPAKRLPARAHRRSVAHARALTSPVCPLAPHHIRLITTCSRCREHPSHASVARCNCVVALSPRPLEVDEGCASSHKKRVVSLWPPKFVRLRVDLGRSWAEGLVSNIRGRSFGGQSLPSLGRISDHLIGPVSANFGQTWPRIDQAWASIHLNFANSTRRRHCLADVD